jgi:hypothetical protein
MSWSLRQRGMRGVVTVTLDGDKLHLTAANDVSIVIEAQQVVRLRAGVDKSDKSGPVFATRIWLQCDDGPLLISVRRQDMNDYAGTIGGFAELLAAEKLETGLTVAGRRWTIGLLTLPLVFALVAWAFALRDKPLWQGMAVSALPLVVLVIAVLATRKWVPRPAGTHAVFGQALRGEA